MFESMKDAAITMALGKIRDKVLDQYLEGIGTVETINYKNKKLFLGLSLEGLPQPIEVECSDICFAPDGSAVTVNCFSANVPFAQTALDRFAAGKSFEIPEGAARFAVVAAKKVLGL
ncbi:MAG: hypothetical protein K1W05_10620 [Desulfovibrio sp.]|jgi:hypothetical protein